MESNIDVYVISLNPKFDLSQLKSIFPNSSVNVQQAVDLREVDTKTLYTSGIVSLNAYNTLKHGRKWYHEVNSKGSVGLVHANRICMKKGSKPLLILEDDFNIRNVNTFVREMTALYDNIDAFDMAVFGAKISKEKTNNVPFMTKDWLYMSQGYFMGAQCVFYSPQGRAKIASLLEEPLEMQLDLLYGFYAETHDIKLIVQAYPGTVTQKAHISSVQSDFCWQCWLPGSMTYRQFFSCILILFVIAVLVYMRKHKTNRS